LAAVITALLVASLMIGTAGAADGDLDPTFSDDGRVVSDFGFEDRAEGVAVQPDGAIVVAGTSCGGDFLVARYNADGSPDTSFDGDGRICVDVGAGSADQGDDVVLLADGRLLVAGTSAGNFALVRLTASGALDTSFGTGGRATYDFGSTDELRDVALAPDGSIVMVGQTAAPGCPSAPVTPGQTAGVAVARALANGAPDPGFGGDGTVVLANENLVQRGFAVTVQSDGRVVVAGQQASCTRVAIDVLLLRLTAGGAPDATFNPVNPAAEAGPDAAVDVAVQPDGRIVVAIDTFVGPATTPARDDAFVVLRLNQDGSADSTFGGDGAAVALFGEGITATPAALAFQGGKVVVGGTAGGDLAVARFNADGSLDTTFGGDGTVVTDFGGTDVIADLAVQPDGKIVAAGRTGSDVALARYGTNGTTPTTSSTTTTTATTTTTLVPSPFARACAVLQQLRARFAADALLAPYVQVLDRVRAILPCS
jgi:uncharacterized delta-60 repeat protein